MNKRLMVAVSILAGLCVGNTYAETATPTPTKLVKPAGNNAQGAINPTTIELQPGVKTFTVRLRSNKTTGYSWYLQSYSHQWIEPISYRYETPAVGMMGAPGLSVWTFRLRKPANVRVPAVARISWRYARPWEASATDTRQETAVFIPAG